MKQLECVVCESEVVDVLDLNDQPLANNLINSRDENFDKFPLGLARCGTCTHGQLTYFVDPSKLFVNYLYASGTSQTLADFFVWFANSLDRRHTRKILEIASNDGSLLTCLSREGYEVTGVDPAANLNAKAMAAGHRVLTGFFPDVKPSEPVDLIVAMNVAAHTPEPAKFMEGVANCLKPDGVAIIQTSQALMLGNGEFDTIYHEHFSFYTIASMSELARRNGLRLEQVRLASVHGTSSLFFLRHSDSNAAPYLFAGGAPFEISWPNPEPDFMSRDFRNSDGVYGAFVSKAKDLMSEVASIVNEHQKNNGQVALVGIAAKALTFIHAAGISPDFYFDEAELKIGKFIPGATNPIQPFSEIADAPGGTLFLIGAWNFADEIMKKIRSIRTSESRFLIHLPKLRIEN